MLDIISDPVYSRLEGPVSMDTLVAIDEALKYHPEGYRHVRMFQIKKWDGFNRLFNMKERCFRTGLLKRVKRTLDKTNIEHRTIFSAKNSEKINDLEERIKKSDEIEENIRKNHISIKAKYEGIQLQGRIVEATSRSIRVKLDRPLRGQSSINYGYGSAGQHVFTKDHNISENGYDSARRALCWAYEDALHAPQRKIVNRLNSKV